MSLSTILVASIIAAAPALIAGPVGSAPGISGETGDDSVTIIGTGLEDGSKGTGSGRTGPIVRYLPVCGGRSKDPRAGSFGACASAATICPDPGDVLAWREVAQVGPDGRIIGWGITGTACLGAGAPAAAVPAFTVEDLRRLPLPKSRIDVQPPSARTLVNVPTNLFTTNAPATFRITLLGTPVVVHATPVSWTWTYGDGTSRTFSTPGAPYPDLSTAHTWSSAGPHAVGLTTSWTATYSVAGGPDLPVDGTATVASPPVTVTAVATRAELVADPRA